VPTMYEVQKGLCRRSARYIGCVNHAS
jgi:hypothetical protein